MIFRTQKNHFYIRIFSYRFYPGTADSLKFSSSTVFIVTTKQVVCLFSLIRTKESLSYFFKAFASFICLALHMVLLCFRLDLRPRYWRNWQVLTFQWTAYTALAVGKPSLSSKLNSSAVDAPYGVASFFIMNLWLIWQSLERIDIFCSSLGHVLLQEI